MNDEERVRLATLLVTLDEGSLTALGNKGLVRRATKDLAGLELRIEETDESVLVHAAEWTVTMPPTGPTKATDTTRATGVSRQVLAATMHLQNAWAPDVLTSASARAQETSTDSVDDSADDFASLDALEVRTLRGWAGAGAFGRAETLVNGSPEVEIEGPADRLVVRFPDHDVEVRLLGAPSSRSAHALLDAFHSTAPRAGHSTWVVAAILLLQKSRGLDVRIEVVRPATPTTGLSQRGAVLAESTRILTGMVARGLAHPSQRWPERLAMVAPAASAAHLPRLDRALRAVAREVDLALERHVRADARRMLDRVAHAWALTRSLHGAMESPPHEIPLALAGRHRSRYLPVGGLDLIGLGAAPWSAASGHAGFTVYFWDVVGRRFLSWSHARPTEDPTSDLRRAFRAEPVWRGAGPPTTFCRQRLRLEDARVNSEGRLSASQATQAALGEEDGLGTALDGLREAGLWFPRWEEVRQRTRDQVSVGLAPDVGPLERLVVLAPRTWGPRRYDELRQRFVWELEDEGGDIVTLSLPWRQTHEEEIGFLESVAPRTEKLDGVLVRVLLRGDLELRPLALLASEGPKSRQVLCPAFDAHLLERSTSNLLRRLRKTFGRDRIETTFDAEDPDGLVTEEDLDSGLPHAIAQRLEAARLQIERRAETGSGRSGLAASDDDLRRVVGELDRIGLGDLARAMEAIPGSPGDLLDAAWSCRVHRQVAKTTVRPSPARAP